MGKLDPLDCKIKPVNPKRNQSWIFIERTDAEAETPILWPPDVKNWLVGKDPDAGKDWRQEEKGTTEDEMVGWHHRLSGHEFEQAPGVGDGQGSLACCRPWGHKESVTTERLNWIDGSCDTKKEPTLEYYYYFHNLFRFQLLFNYSATSDSLQPHGLQHTRLPCPSLGVCSDSCLLSQWCHPTISSSYSHFRSIHIDVNGIISFFLMAG